MSFTNKIKEIRKTKGISQKELASLVGVDQSRISAYENGEEIPNDVALNIISVLNSPRLSLAYSNLRRSEVVNVPMPSNINDDVVNVLDVVMEEAEEVLEAGKLLKKIIRNKKCRDDFTDQEMDRVLVLEEQIADLIPCIKMHFVTMAENFDLDIKRLEKRMYSKMKRKNLI